MMNKVKILSGFGLMFAFSQAFSGAITDIKVDNPSATERLVKITFDSQVPTLSSFATANPARIALDFPGTTVKMGKQASLNDSIVKSAVAAEGNGRTRVLLSLSENSNYTTHVEGNTLVVKINSKSADVAFSSAAPVDATNVSNTSTAYAENSKPASVDFRRMENGAGRFELALPVADAPVDVNRVGDKIVVTLLGNKFSNDQLRKFGVNDFGTPATNVNVYNEGRNGKAVISAKGAWTFASFQTPEKFVIDINETKVDKDGRSVLGGQKFVGNKLSLNFQNVEVRTVLQVIAEFTKLNIVVSDQVTGNMTLRLTDVPWDQALNLILESKNLVQHREGNVIRIETTNEYGVRVADLDKVVATGPIEQRIFKLKYKDVNTFKDVLKIEEQASGSTGKGTLLSSRGSVLIDPDTNTLIVNDVRPIIQKMEQLIQELDIAKKQVMIEARIVEASNDFTRKFGVQFGGMRIGNTSIGTDFENAFGGNNRHSGDFDKSGMGKYAPNVNLPNGSASTGGAFGIFHAWSSYAIGLSLTASQAESTSRIISTPRILTADREEGKIEQGQEIPYQEATSSGATSTSFKTATTSLTVTPQITPDGNIIMDVEITKDSPTQKWGSELALDVKQIKTKATVENGGTVVIGGIYTTTESDQTTKVPFLGDIPIIGRLFKSNSKTDERSELLIFLTPRIIADVDAQTRYQ